MSGFDPGEGWREVGDDYDLLLGKETVRHNDGERIRWWVREQPVSPLPTEPWTLMHVTWKDGTHEVLILQPGEKWLPLGVAPASRSAREFELVSTDITGFEVLAVPVGLLANYERERVRRETAKVVLERIRISMLAPQPLETCLSRVGREFGVDA